MTLKLFLQTFATLLTNLSNNWADRFAKQLKALRWFKTPRQRFYFEIICPLSAIRNLNDNLFHRHVPGGYAHPRIFLTLSLVINYYIIR